jgi:tyrosine-protein phosphatase SIW14
MKFAALKFSRALVVIFVAAALCGSARAQQVTDVASPSAPPERKFAQKLSVSGLPNLGEISPNLFRGAQPSREGLNELAKMGIGVVIDLKGDRDSERDEVTKLGMQYISIPSQCSHMTDDGVAKFLSILRENPDKKVFVHCQYGVDRTGMMIAAYRMTEQGWAAEESLREMELFGFSTKHKMICPGLTSFESNFPSAFVNDPAFQNLRSPAAASSAPSNPPDPPPAKNKN